MNVNQTEIKKWTKDKFDSYGSFLESPENPFVKLQSTGFEKLIFQHVFNVRKK